jgi:hypothetical protein
MRRLSVSLDVEWQPTYVGVDLTVAQAKALVATLQEGIEVAEGDADTTYDATMRLSDDAAIDVQVHTYMVKA